MIGIINYGVGNIKAFQNIYEKMHVKSLVVSNKKDLQKCSKIILPGVGHFDYAMNKLINSGLKDPLDEIVLNKKMPVLGICVGMQMMARSSEEGKSKGLGWIDAEVKLINTEKLSNKPLLPHMGWNNINVLKKNILTVDFNNSNLFYFLHSYYFKCDDIRNIIATCNYGKKFACIVNKKNIYGIQCHPEKSHYNGETFLKNFSQI
jgi:imidazole glycerol-phosphate synthase subunit HisH